MEKTYISSHLIHPLAIKICEILSQNQYQSFIVGGCVRDIILGKIPKDYDIATDASPQEIMKIFPKTIPTGLQHGTVTVCMGNSVSDNFEVTTFRIEGEYKDGRRPEEVFFVMNIEQDLARRDLTINAMAYDPIANILIDPFNGIQDLQQGLLKAVGNPTVRFQEDGLRIMRVARFASCFAYNIDKETLTAMSHNLETLKKVSKERIKDELSKILTSEFASYGLQILLESKSLYIACPSLAERQLPLLIHQNRCQGSLEVQLAFLYNKLPITQTEQDLLNLKFSNKEIKRVIFLLQLVEKFNTFIEKDTPFAYKSFMALVKNHSLDSWQQSLAQFIQLAKAMEINVEFYLNKYNDEVVFCRKDMLLNGNDLIENGLDSGPIIKKCLDECYLEILRYPERNTKEYLIKYSFNVR